MKRLIKNQETLIIRRCAFFLSRWINAVGVKMMISLLARWKWPGKKPATIDDYDKNGLTPLLSAVFIGDLARVRTMLDEGANPNKPQRGEPMCTPYWHAKEDFGLEEIASLLRHYGAR